MPEFKHLFSPIKVGRMTVPNRIVETPHGNVIGRRDGLPDDINIAYEVQKARGGVGWIGNSGVQVPFPLAPGFRFSGSLNPYAQAPDVSSFPAFPERWRRFSDAIHEHGAVVSVQLIFLTNAVGPSAIQPSRAVEDVPHALDVSELKEICANYARVAARCREGGVDAVEIHAAHDCVPEWFMSPYSNRRTDEYGGSLENRMRFPLEIIDAIRSAVGNDFTVGIRCNTDQFREGGYNLDDFKKMAKIMADTGKLDFMSVDVGTYWGHPSYIQPMYYPLAGFAYVGAAVKEVVNIPVLYAGRVNDPVLAEQLLADGQMDLVGMTRATIADPEFPRKAREGNLDDIRKCIGCNNCIRLIVGYSTTVTCAVNPVISHELNWLPLKPAAPKKRVVVVGAGAAGMETARLLVERGHQVTVLERGPELGGQVNIAAKAPNKEGFLDLVRWHNYQIKKYNMDVRFNTEATPEAVIALNPDAVVVAVGSVARSPDAQGLDRPNVAQMRDVLSEKAQVGQNVLVVCEEDHFEGASVADFLASRGKNVQVIHHWAQLGADIERYSKPMVMFRLNSAGVRISAFTALRRVEDKAAVVYDTLNGQERRIEGIDSVVLACGSVPNTGLYDALKGRVKELYLIGSAYAPRQLLETTQQAAEVGRLI